MAILYVYIVHSSYPHPLLFISLPPTPVIHPPTSMLVLSPHSCVLLFYDPLITTIASSVTMELIIGAKLARFGYTTEASYCSSS